MRGIPHHMLDVTSPKEVFSAHDFRAHAILAVMGVARGGKLPILCGGTGFYIDALVGRIHLPDVPRDPSLRQRLEKKSTATLFTMLKKRDPRRAHSIDPHNKHRLIRALEIAEAIGKSPARSTKKGSDFEALWIGLAWNKKELERRIRARLMARLKHGMIREARRLHAGGLSYKRMESFGLEYRSLSRFLRKNISRAELEQELARDIPRYAKRQLTYWRRNKDIRWFTPSQKHLIPEKVRAWIKD